MTEQLVRSAPIDPSTQHALEYQGRRMRAVLHGMVPPDRKEALLIQKRVDDLLDRRPSPLGRMPDGELIWSDASPFVQGQILPPGTSVAVNNTGEAEPVVTGKDIVAGGVGLLEHRPPERGMRTLTFSDEQDIAKFRNQLDRTPETEVE
jgi:hypothetical protein